MLMMTQKRNLPGCSSYQSAQMSYLPCRKFRLFVRCLKGKYLELNDFRPIVLTRIIMKCFERITFHHLSKQIEGKLDPLQFAYKRNGGVEDAILSLLHDTYIDLDKGRMFCHNHIYRLVISV